MTDSKTAAIYVLVEWYPVEASVSCTAACLPTLRPLFNKGSSTESFVARFRSFLSLRSRGSSGSRSTRERSTGERSNSKGSNSEAKYQWYELHNHNDSVVKSGAIKQEEYKGIRVDRGFSSVTERAPN